MALANDIMLQQRLDQSVRTRADFFVSGLFGQIVWGFVSPTL